MSIYGADFANLYNDGWGGWSRRLWPRLYETVQKTCPDAHSWLDLCCGAGQTLALAGSAGFDVTGVDQSAHQLEHARRNAPRATLVRADVREIDLDRRFDVVTCLFDSLNYLLRVSDLRSTFARVHRHLAPGGVFIFDMNTLHGFRTRWQNAWVPSHDRDRFVVMESTFDEKTGLAHAVFTGFIREGKLYRRFEEEHVQRGYPAEQIARLLARAHFTCRMFDDDGGRAKKTSCRLFHVCRLDPRAAK